MATERETRERFVTWGQQTIVYAFCVKGNARGRELNPSMDPAFTNAAVKEAETIANLDLWGKAIQQTGGKFSNDTGLKYVQLVLEWVARHLDYSKPD